MRKFNFFIIVSTILLTSCRKFVDVGDPPTQLTSVKVFNSNATATSALLSIYSQMEAPGFMYELSVFAGTAADELDNYYFEQARIDIYNNNITTDNVAIGAFWSRMYASIYNANSIIEGLEKSIGVSAEVKKQLTGEALFVRAFFHHLLLRIFGDIPLALSTNYLENGTSTRQPETVVYQQIEADLKKAIELLSENYVNATNASTTERTRPNRWAAKALLARVLLYQSKWAEAEAFATEVLNAGSQYTLLADLTKVFLKNSQESIWQIQAVWPNINTYAGAFFPFSGVPFNTAISLDFMSKFEIGDKRKTEWTKTIVAGGNSYSYPYKYRVWQNATSITEYTMVLRVAELYLIRAEARAHQSSFTGANDDLNLIRTRAGLPIVNHNTLNDLLTEIENQRRYELFAESGDRWMDLRRTGRVDQVISAVKGTNWTATDQLFPIPQIEINRNSLLTQNPGY